MKTDQRLIDDYLNGDEKALVELIQRYLKPVYSFIYRFTNKSRDIDDIVQETFFKAWKNLKKPILGLGNLGRGFNPEKGKFKTWLFTVARNTAIDWMRKNKMTNGGKKEFLFSDLSFKDENGEENNFEENLAGQEILPDEIFARTKDKEILANAISQLPLKYREVLLLKYDNDITFEEMSKILKEPLNTVKSRHRRGVGMMKKSLGK